MIKIKNVFSNFRNFSDEESVVVTSTATAISKGGTVGRVIYEKKAKSTSVHCVFQVINSTCSIIDYSSNDARFSITTKLQVNKR